MTTPKKLSWPTALVICIAIVAIVVTILAGPALGLDPETLKSVVGAQGILAAVVAGVMRQLLGGSDDGASSEIERKRADRMRPPPDAGALGVPLAIVAAACSVLTSGCSARAYGAQADLVALGGIAAAGADEVLVEARARELDAVLEQAREECSPAGCDEERAEHHRAELAAAEARWAPVLACRAPVVEALRSWADGISTALQVATDDVGIALLLRLGGRFVAAYSALVACVEAVAPDVDLPGLPPALSALVGGAS